MADSGNYRIVLLDVDPVSGALSYAGSFGSHGSADGEFDRPLAVAVSQGSGRIYVVDSDNVNVSGCNHRIQRFSAAGVWEASFGSVGSAKEQLQWPHGISVAANGFVYIADTGNNRIKCMTSGGHVLWTYGSAGSGEGQFTRPMDVREGASGWIYVADTGNSRLVMLDASKMPAELRFIGNFGGPGGGADQFRFPRGVFAAADGSGVYVADTLNRRVSLVGLSVDADGDGMDDLWENCYYSTLDPLDGSDWNEDPDGDGVINLGEFRIGTNPLKSDSNNNGVDDLAELACRLNPAGDGYDLLLIREFSITRKGLHFNVESGGVYQVEVSTNIIANIWEPVGEPVNASSNGVYKWDVSVPDADEYYYRIRRKN